MRIVEVVEAPSKTAVFAFGRMNPPTAGHKKLVNTIMKQAGDHYLFLGPAILNSGNMFLIFIFYVL